MQVGHLHEGMVVRDASRRGRVGTVLAWASDGYGSFKVRLKNASREWDCAPNNIVKLLDATIPMDSRGTLPGVLTLIESFPSSVIQLQCAPELEHAMENEVRLLRLETPDPGQIYVDHETAKRKPTMLRGRVCFDPKLIPLVQAVGARVSWSENDQIKNHKARAYEWWFVAEALRTTRIPLGCSNEWLNEE